MTTADTPKGYRRDFLECRAAGHQWDHSPVLSDHPTYLTIKGLDSECLGCGTERTRWIYSNGRRFGSPRYIYPDGYQIRRSPNQSELPKPAAWRSTYIHTLGFHEDNVTPIKTNNRKRTHG